MSVNNVITLMVLVYKFAPTTQTLMKAQENVEIIPGKKRINKM